MKKITTLEALMEEIESGNYNYYGLRNANENDIANLDRGYLDCSADFVDNNPTGELLNGTCAIGVHEYMSEGKLRAAYNVAKNVYNNTNIILLIGDERQEYGEDDGEVILGYNGCGADVIAIVEL